MATSTRKQVQKQEQRNRMLELRMEGLSYREIAMRVGLKSGASAYKDVKKAIADITRENAEQFIELELARYDKLWQEPYKQALKGDLFAVDRCLKIIADRAKMLGLYDRVPDNDNISKAADALVAMMNAAKEVNAQNDEDAGAVQEAGPLDSGVDGDSESVVRSDSIG